jgi:hypothetical protein
VRVARPDRLELDDEPGRRGAARQAVGDGVPAVAQQRGGGAHPQRAAALDGESVSLQGERGGKTGEPLLVGGVERPHPPGVEAVRADRGEQPAAGDEAERRLHRDRPGRERRRQITACGQAGEPGDASAMGTTRASTVVRRATVPARTTMLSSARRPGPRVGGGA